MSYTASFQVVERSKNKTLKGFMCEFLLYIISSAKHSRASVQPLNTCVRRVAKMLVMLGFHEFKMERRSQGSY